MFVVFLYLYPQLIRYRMRNTALTITLLASMTIYDVAAQTPIITRGPYLNLGTSSSVVVRWRTYGTKIILLNFDAYMLSLDGKTK